MIPFFVFLFCLFTTYATYLIVTRKTAARRARVGQRLADMLVYTPDAEDAPVRLARDEPMSKMPTLNRWLTGVQVGWMTKTSEPRTFSSSLIRDSPFLNALTIARPTLMLR